MRTMNRRPRGRVVRTRRRADSTRRTRDAGRGVHAGDAAGQRRTEPRAVRRNSGRRCLFDGDSRRRTRRGKRDDHPVRCRGAPRRGAVRRQRTRPAGGGRRRNRVRRRPSGDAHPRFAPWMGRPARPRPPDYRRVRGTPVPVVPRRGVRRRVRHLAVVPRRRLVGRVRGGARRARAGRRARDRGRWA